MQTVAGNIMAIGRKEKDTSKAATVKPKVVKPKAGKVAAGRGVVVPQRASVRKVTTGSDAQQQILDAVDALFYSEGARAVGIDAVVKRAGVNKMSLYRQFESKDALLQEYLVRRDQRFWGNFDASMAKHPGNPRMQLQQFFIDWAERAGSPDYRGCPFINVAIEFPDRAHPARQMVASNKRQLWDRLHALAVACGAKDSRLLTNGMALLIEGAYAASQTYNPAKPLLETMPRIAGDMIDAACRA
jgi:AcrR family transcriptional regulator